MKDYIMYYVLTFIQAWANDSANDKASDDMLIYIWSTLSYAIL
jgi:hypothetical protein